MQYHSEFNFHRLPSRDRTPWNIAERYGRADVVDEFRRWARAREALVPYLHEQALSGIARGLPLMRAMPLVTTEEAAWAYPLQFGLGDDLLVAPVTEPGADTVDLFVPAGDWIDLTTGRRRESGPWRRPTPSTDVAVLVRASAWGRLTPVARELANVPVV